LINQAGFWVAAPLYSSVLKIVDEEKNKPPSRLNEGVFMVFLEAI
jgi:hypothetical protein